MSNSRAKAARSKAKNARQAPAPDGVCTGAKKRKRKAAHDWEVIYVGRGIFHGLVWHTAETQEDAENWVAKTARSYGYNNTNDWEISRKAVWTHMQKPNA